MADDLENLSTGELIALLEERISGSTQVSALFAVSGLSELISQISYKSDDPSNAGLSVEAQKLDPYLGSMKTALENLQELEKHLVGGIKRLLADISQAPKGQARDTLRSLGEKVEELILKEENKGTGKLMLEALMVKVDVSMGQLVKSVRRTSIVPEPVKDARAHADPISYLIQEIKDLFHGNELGVDRLLEATSDIVRNCPNSQAFNMAEAVQLQQDLRRIKYLLGKLEHLRGYIELGMNEIFGSISLSNSGEDAHKFRLFVMMVSYLTLQLPSLPRMQLKGAHFLDKPLRITSFALHNLLHLPKVLQEPEMFDKDPILEVAAQEFVMLYGYDKLDIEHKMCLFCFAAFPANAIVKKRLLVHWWIGEDFADKKPDVVFKTLMTHRLINPVTKKRKLVGFKMDPLVHLMVVMLASKEGFLDFDSSGIPTANYSWSHRACLVTSEERDSRKDLLQTSGLNQEKLRTIINVNDRYPDFPFKWFSKLKYMHVLCLGGWLGSLGECLEIEDTRFLNATANLKLLRLFSLQGISGISKLPNSICGLKCLRILDLRDCTHLEELPHDIGSMHNLRHLDVSECCWLRCIPKSLHQLKHLEVLKGFIVGASVAKESCTLMDLEAMYKLRKLSIATYAGENFPNKDEVDVLRRLKQLQKLSIEWRGRLVQSDQEYKLRKSNRKAIKESNTKTWWKWGKGVREKGQPTEKEAEIPVSIDPETGSSSNGSGLHQSRGALDKLDLQGFPGNSMPDWIEDRLMPRKLIIRGGNLENLGRAQGGSWPVMILCLKFLNHLEIVWGELEVLFPQLVYFQSKKCPKLAYIPWHEDKVVLREAGEPLPSVAQVPDLGLSWSFLNSPCSYPA